LPLGSISLFRLQTQNVSKPYQNPLERVLDEALADGRLDLSLPLLKQRGLEILGKEYETTALAEADIPQALARYYASEHATLFSARREEIEQAGRELLGIYSSNVFPEMKISWGTYPNHIGHTPNRRAASAATTICMHLRTARR